MDARDAVVKFLEDWGFKLTNYQITHYPVNIIDEDEPTISFDDNKNIFLIFLLLIYT